MENVSALRQRLEKLEAESSEETLNRDTLLSVYSILAQDERHLRDMYQKRLSFYVGLLTAVLVASVSIMARSDHSIEDYVGAAFGFFAAAIISRHGINSVKRVYCHFVEKTMARMRIEAKLGIREAYWNDSDAEDINKILVLNLKILSKEWFEDEEASYNSMHGLATREVSTGYYKKTKSLLDGVIGASVLLIALTIGFYAYRHQSSKGTTNIVSVPPIQMAAPPTEIKSLDSGKRF